MGSYALIDDYLDELERNFAKPQRATELVDELKDHLYSAAESAQSDGADVASAERTALDGLSHPTQVAALYVSSDPSLGEPSVPTSFTKRCGQAGIVAGLLWASLAGLWLLIVYLETRLGQFEGTPQRIWMVAGFCLVGAGAMTTLTVFGVYRRHGALSRMGKSGIVIIGLSIFVSLVGFAVTRRLRFDRWGMVLAAGAILFVIAIWRRNLAPRWAAIAFGWGMTAGIATLFVLDMLSVDAPDHVDGHAHHGVINASTMGLTVGTLLTGVGIAGLGYWLMREDPVEIRPVASA